MKERFRALPNESGHPHWDEVRDAQPRGLLYCGTNQQLGRDLQSAGPLELPQFLSDLTPGGFALGFRDVRQHLMERGKRVPPEAHTLTCGR